jgi:hypothetical protein
MKPRLLSVSIVTYNYRFDSMEKQAGCICLAEATELISVATVEYGNALYVPTLVLY